jgi:bifunctional UDP-N-acetylglucosamine pyrophosphorylase/glucosamine-1-phosphate N-acetyltransferase
VRSPETVLIIPAAGAGSRLKSSIPKVLAPVNGRPMIDHLLALYRHAVGRFVLVLHPAAEEAVRDRCGALAPDLDITYALQPEPTGMLDAILLAAPEVPRGETRRIWITWCDQVGVHPDTIAALQRLSTDHPEAPVILPTARQEPPYIHLDRDGTGRIVAVRMRREGDDMPAVGESDMGLFSFSPEAYFGWLPRYGNEARLSTATRERNFIPFIPWLESRGQHVLTFPCTDPIEATGINTPEERRRLEEYLLQRGRK